VNVDPIVISRCATAAKGRITAARSRDAVTAGARGAAALTIAALVAACGSNKSQSTPTSPTPTGRNTIHDGLNSVDDRSSLSIRYSLVRANNDGPRTFDDFTSSATEVLRSVSWQGSYCDARFQVPLVPPQPAASTFRVSFYSDLDGRPAGTQFGVAALHESTYSPVEANEQLQFALASNESVGCGSKIPASFSYYGYSVVLRTPFAITQGRRYWLAIVADMSASDMLWGWRVGRQSNGLTFFSIQQGAVNSTYPNDQAFSLSD
jgi:hypothetical protein